MQKLSTFFTLEEGLTNRLGVKQEVPDNKVYLYNMNYSASRLDLIRFSLNMDFKVINWFLEEETANELKVHPSSAHRKGLGIEFKVEGVHNRNVFDLIKNKILGKNTVVFSASELIYNEITDSIFISFKTNMAVEQGKIGIILKDRTFKWLYTDGEKVVSSNGQNGRTKGKSFESSTSNKSNYRGKQQKRDSKPYKGRR